MSGPGIFRLVDYVLYMYDSYDNCNNNEIYLGSNQMIDIPRSRTLFSFVISPRLFLQSTKRPRRGCEVDEVASLV